MMATIAARKQWNHTGILLVEGMTYRMEAHGTWVDLFLKYGPEGGPSRFGYLRRFENRRRKPDADWFTLCGAIDQMEATQFAIGGGREYKATRSGELTCFANDVPGSFFLFNNWGSVDLAVTPA